MTILLIILAIEHWFIDFPWLPSKKLLEAKESGSPLFPIFLHALAHAIVMSLTVYLYTGSLTKAKFAFLFEFITHFIIDVWKGKMNKWYPIFKDVKSKHHWILFGFDQLLHFIVIIIIAQHSTITIYEKTLNTINSILHFL